MNLDALDRGIINHLQEGFPLCDRPYAAVATRLGTTEAELLTRLDRLLETGVLTRFGPLYHAERLGGGLTLAALHAEPDAFDRIAGLVNAHPEVAHNYAREHHLNMWFVLATETPERVGEVIAEIEAETGCPVVNLPKLQEFFVGLRFEV